MILIYLGDEVATVLSQIQELRKRILSDETLTEGTRNSLLTDTTALINETKSLSRSSLSDVTKANLPGRLTVLTSKFQDAQSGKGIFGDRQRLEEKIKQKQQRPGRSQTVLTAQPRRGQTILG